MEDAGADLCSPEPVDMPAPITAYHVVAALIRQGGSVLLVKERGPDDPEPLWALPGGVLEPGELLTEGLAREVREETGLEILDPGRLLYLLHSGHPGSVVFVFEVRDWTGQLCGDDPNGFVCDVAFLPVAEAIARLDQLPYRSMREPIVAYLRGEVGPGAVWLYRGNIENSELVTVIGGQQDPP